MHKEGLNNQFSPSLSLSVKDIGQAGWLRCLQTLYANSLHNLIGMFLYLIVAAYYLQFSSSILSMYMTFLNQLYLHSVRVGIQGYILV